MNITPTDAREALSAADDAVQSVKRAVDRQASRIVLIWGVVYLLAPLSMYIWPRWGIIPHQLLLIGAIGFSIYDTRRNSLVSGPSSWRIGGLWWLTFAFGWIWFLILSPATFQDPAANADAIMRQMWAYGVSLAMFVYIIMGLWIGRLYVVTGLAVTCFTVLGLLWLGEWYWLWCAITGGGTLLAAGFWLRRQGRI